MNMNSADVDSQRCLELGNVWRAFLSSLTGESLANAKASVRAMLGVATLLGKTIPAIGSSSGPFTIIALAAWADRLGFNAHLFRQTNEGGRS